MNLPGACAVALLGLVLLRYGAKWLVDGASQLAAHFHISPLVIGLTVVAYGTSAPEIVAVIGAVIEGHSQLSIGTVLGSNVANIGLILGLTAMVAPLAITRSILNRELPFLIAVTLFLIFIATGSQFGRGFGLFLVSLMVLYPFVTLRWPREKDSRNESKLRHSKLASSMLTTVGLLALIGGAQLLVSGATVVARGVGSSEFVIGVTLVAVGSSIPELATAFEASAKESPDMVVGTVIGSNLINILGALGISTAIKPIAVESQLMSFEFPALAFFTVTLALFLYISGKLNRWHGFVLFSSYAVFIWLLFR